jgi:hypothetical protein
MSPRATQLIFLAVGAAHVAFGAVMLFAPGPFYDGLAAFPPRSDHFIRDVGAFSVALGLALAAAARRPAWRGPVLFVAVVQYAIHTANHLYDVNRPVEGWVGPVNAALVAAGLVLLAVLAWAARRRRRPGESRPGGPGGSRTRARV